MEMGGAAGAGILSEGVNVNWLRSITSSWSLFGGELGDVWWDLAEVMGWNRHERDEKVEQKVNKQGHPSQNHKNITTAGDGRP